MSLLAECSGPETHLQCPVPQEVRESRIEIPGIPQHQCLANTTKPWMLIFISVFIYLYIYIFIYYYINIFMSIFLWKKLL